MTAEQFLSLAESLRSYAHHSGRDVNDANLFVHTALMRAVRRDEFDPSRVSARDLVAQIEAEAA